MGSEVRESYLLTWAVFSGSMSSGGGGKRAVLTAQKRHPLVQVSPAMHSNKLSHTACGSKPSHLHPAVQQYTQYMQYSLAQCNSCSAMPCSVT